MIIKIKIQSQRHEIDTEDAPEIAEEIAEIVKNIDKRKNSVASLIGVIFKYQMDKYNPVIRMWEFVLEKDVKKS